MHRSRICHEQPSGALVFLLRGICEFRISHFSKQLISKQLQFLMVLIVSVLKIATVLEFILQNVKKKTKTGYLETRYIIHCLWLFYTK